MPPRYAYWTILIDSQPTAFRAREREELLPTLNQLRRKNADVVLKWFGRGKLWDSPDQERMANLQPRTVEKRGHEWRPGGQHKDPRARFKGKKQTGPREQDPWREKPAGPPRARPPAKPFGAGGPTSRTPPGPGARRPPSRWPRKPKPPGRG